jgi:gluconolactonase
LPFNGVYRIPAAPQHKPGAPPDRQSLQLVIKDLPHPNGIAFSPDQQYLYVDNSEPQKLWMRYHVRTDGTLDTGTVFFDDSSDTAPGGPDGMKVDEKGDLYSAAPSSVWIFSPEGKHLGTIHMHAMVGNLTWGDADGRTLYITASANVYRVRLKIPGVRP